MSVPIFLASLISLVNSDVAPQKQIDRDVKDLEQATLSYVASVGTVKEAAARKLAATKRQLVASHGRPAIKPLMKLLTHKQVNVRRGAAITLMYSVEKHGIDDEKLLDTVLRRMIEDPDIKCRSNLYHVVNAIVANIKKRHRPD